MDPVARGHPEWAANALAAQKRRGPCGCAYQEFSECVKTRVSNNCTSRLFDNPQWVYFCMPGDEVGSREANCTVELAVHRMKTCYAAIGITEELELSVALFEQKLPAWFHNASRVYAASRSHRHSNPTSYFNTLTNSSMTRSVSNEAKALLGKMPWFQEERYFHEQVVRRFWRDVAASGLLDADEGG